MTNIRKINNFPQMRNLAIPQVTMGNQKIMMCLFLLPKEEQNYKLRTGRGPATSSPIPSSCEKGGKRQNEESAEAFELDVSPNAKPTHELVEVQEMPPKKLCSTFSKACSNNKHGKGMGVRTHLTCSGATGNAMLSQGTSILQLSAILEITEKYDFVQQNITKFQDHIPRRAISNLKICK